MKVCPKIRLRGLLNRLIAPQDQRRQNRKHAHHRQEHALSQSNTQIHADQQRHETEHQQANNRGHRRRNDRRKSPSNCAHHRLWARAIRSLLLAVAIHQDDRIIHGQDQLKDRSDRESHICNRPTNQVRPQIQDNGHTYRDQEQNRLKPGRAHRKQDQCKQTNSNHHDPQWKL